MGACMGASGLGLAPELRPLSPAAWVVARRMGAAEVETWEGWREAGAVRWYRKAADQRNAGARDRHWRLAEAAPDSGPGSGVSAPAPPGRKATGGA